MTVIAPKQLRGPGTVGVTQAATGAIPNTSYHFLALMDAADIADPTLTITLRLFLDARLVWGSNNWTCGVVDRHGAPVTPNFFYSCPQTPPTNFRAEVDLPKAINIGLDVTLV